MHADLILKVVEQCAYLTVIQRLLTGSQPALRHIVYDHAEADAGVLRQSDHGALVVGIDHIAPQAGQGKAGIIHGLARPGTGQQRVLALEQITVRVPKPYGERGSCTPQCCVCQV